MGKWKTPADVKYSKTDEWVRVDGMTATIGITDYAQDQLNDIVFLELPQVGATLAKEAVFGLVESVKAASDLHMPVSGTVLEVNNSLEDTPETINSDPYGEAWLIKVSLDFAGEIDELMDAEAYEIYCRDR